MPLTDHVAIVSLTSDLPTRAFLQVAAAVQKQVTRDFSPLWGLPATVDAFEDLGSVPSDYHHVVVFRDPDELASRLAPAIGEDRAARLIAQFNGEQLAGVHLNGFTRQPFALVAYSDWWSVTLSHEVLELIADPYGNRLVAATVPGAPERRVNYLVEVCDPCLSLWYPVNGVPVADFYTPRYFDPVRTAGLRYSYTGELEYPLQILEGGYLTFIDPIDNGLYQLAAYAAEPELLYNIADLSGTSEPLRALVDADPRTPRLATAAFRPASTAAAAPGAYVAAFEAARGGERSTADAVASAGRRPS